MTPSKYLFLRVAGRFGYAQKSIRLAQASTERQLLKEAEIFLGEAIWRETDGIEALSMEYWNLRKLTKDYDRIAKEIEQIQGKFEETHQQQTEGWKSANESLQDLIEERKEILGQFDKLTRARDRIVSRAHDIRRNYDGLKIKQDVLSKEGHKLREIEKTSARLSELKNDFNQLKTNREQIAHEISVASARIQEIEATVSERKQHEKSKETADSQYIGDANQQISSRRAELNTLNTQMRQLHADIGRKVSRNLFTDPKCKKAIKDHRSMIEIMHALHRSIQYNIKLAQFG